MTDPTLKSRVREAFKNAHENGYEFIGLTPLEIAGDMIEFCADLESEQPEEIARILEELGDE